MTINQLLTQPFQFVKHRQFQTVHCNLHNEERKEIVKSLFDEWKRPYYNPKDILLNIASYFTGLSKNLAVTILCI